MSVHSFFRRLARNDNDQLLPTTAFSSYLERLPGSTNVPLTEPTHPATMIPPLPLHHPDAFRALSREGHHLQQSLQAFIDAQSEGLLAGSFTAAGISHADETASRGRRTPSSESPARRNNLVLPVRQPAPSKPGLQGARRGIARAMSQLEGLKAHEAELLEGALSAQEEDLTTAEALRQRREGLEASIRGIEAEEASRHARGLREEERLLDEEIRDLETKLAGMKARHRQLRAEIEGLDNRVQSQLSSYRAALALAEEETRKFLTRPSGPTGRGLRPGKRSGESVWELPVGRRTLPMAEEQFREEHRMLLKRIAEVDEERTALEEGKQVWADVVREVTGVEKLLRNEMQRLNQSSTSSSPSVATSYPTTQRMGLPPETSVGDATTAAAAGGGVGGGGGGGGGERYAGLEGEDQAHGMHTVLLHIEAARKRVEAHWRTSVARGWSLLVCCVGAELEALKQGSDVLRAALGDDADLEDEEEKEEEGEGQGGRTNGKEEE